MTEKEIEALIVDEARHIEVCKGVKIWTRQMKMTWDTLDKILEFTPMTLPPLFIVSLRRARKLGCSLNEAFSFVIHNEAHFRKDEIDLNIQKRIDELKAQIRGLKEE